jgi:putative CRISPR-associated protein (TIGR02619 family)
MRRLVVSTVGTSLLTNQIDRKNHDEANWWDLLSKSANLKESETPEEVLRIVQALEKRAEQKLAEVDVRCVRKASAELNGIYGMYESDLSQGKLDTHWLVSTDTLQGKTTASIVKNFLLKAGVNTDIFTPEGLSMANTECFSGGIDKLLEWFEYIIPGHKASNYQICLNLVGSFKSLQGYMNTIGMFYADEIIYIFEGENSEVITIPRLPVIVDESVIHPYVREFALMSVGEVSSESVSKIQESLIYKCGDVATLSTWGKLIWGKCKGKLLSGALLDFLNIGYSDAFLKDYNGISDPGKRVELQETIAKVSNLLVRNNSDLTQLKTDGALQYNRYSNTKKIDHFRVNLAIRVSSVLVGQKLILLNYGTHDHVQGSLKTHDNNYR